jgi:hypothetical protein
VGETVLAVCIEVSKSRDHGKKIEEQRERESKRKIEGGDQ